MGACVAGVWVGKRLKELGFGGFCEGVGKGMIEGKPRRPVSGWQPDRRAGDGALA